MEMNQFLFPAPTASYSSAGFIGEIIYIPKYDVDEETSELIQFGDSTQGVDQPGGDFSQSKSRTQSAAGLA